MDWKQDKPIINRDHVMMVYTGKQGCMCGCKGKYKYRKAAVAAGTANRGYEVEAGDVNEGVVTRVLNELAKLDGVEVGEIYNREKGDSLFYLWDDRETGRRIAVYTLPGAPYVRPEPPPRDPAEDERELLKILQATGVGQT
jgi:hypothetical protein